MKKIFKYEATVKIDIEEVVDEKDIKKYCEENNIDDFEHEVVERFNGDILETLEDEFQINDEKYKSSAKIENSNGGFKAFKEKE